VSTFMSTLPGDISGLLRRGSPVHWRDEQTPFVVAWVGPWPDADLDDGAIVQAAPCGYGLISVEDTARNFALDLTDRTGCAHAAAYAYATGRGREADGWRLFESALHFEDMSPEDTDRLARLCLRLAGRTL